MISSLLLSHMKQIREASSVDLINRDVFLKNLVFVAFVIKASEEITREAIQHSEGSLREYFCEHLEEELGHFDWLKRDLQFADINLDDCTIPAEAVAMAGSQYYLAKHIHASAILGYMAALECFAMPLDLVEKLEERHGKEVCATLRYHAEHDVAHGKDVLDMIDKVDPKYHRLICDNAIQTTLYIQNAIKRFV